MTRTELFSADHPHLKIPPDLDTWSMASSPPGIKPSTACFTAIRLLPRTAPSRKPKGTRHSPATPNGLPSVRFEEPANEPRLPPGFATYPNENAFHQGPNRPQVATTPQAKAFNSAPPDPNLQQAPKHTRLSAPRSCWTTCSSSGPALFLLGPVDTRSTAT